MAKLGQAFKKKSFGGSSNHMMLAGEVIKIDVAGDGDATLHVKDAAGEVFAVRQIADSKLADIALRVQIGKDNVDDKLRGIGVGTRLYSDSAFLSDKEVDGLKLVNIKGATPLSEKEILMNGGANGVQIAFCPFNGEHTDFKRGRDGFTPIKVMGDTAKVSTIMAGEGQSLTDATAEAVKAAIVATAEKTMAISGGRSISIHLMSEDGGSFDFSTPIYKDPSKAYKARKNGDKLTKEDYLDDEGKLEALDKLVEEQLAMPAGETIEGTIVVFPRTTETLTFKSAESHNFLINVAFADDKAETPEALAEGLKNKGWPFRSGLVVMGESGSGKPVLNKFIPNTYDKPKALPEALAAVAVALMPNFNMATYEKNVKELREEAERNRSNRGTSTPAAEHDEAPVFSEGDVPSFDDEDVPSFED